ncbi:MAG TPA: hypothetical protein VKV04_00270 [Verrucomicrobiae bacterium]|nr:hypothetical protein [Verrucomicrobiae bacterium]
MKPSARLFVSVELIAKEVMKSHQQTIAELANEKPDWQTVPHFLAITGNQQ